MPRLRPGPAALAFAFAVAGVLFPAFPARAQTAAEAYAKIKPAIYKIWSLNAAGVPTDTGTGFVVSSDATSSMVVTAAHVVDKAVKVSLDVDRKSVAAHVVAKIAADVALLKVDVGNLTPASFSKEIPVEGDQIAVAGFPGSTTQDLMIESGLGERVSLIGVGTIGSLLANGQQLELANLPIDHGLSGGPAFDPLTGDVMAMVDSKFENQRRGIGISAQSVIATFLKQNNVAFTVDPAPRPAGVKVAGFSETAGDAQQNAMQKMYFAQNYSGAASVAADYLLTHPDDNMANGIMVEAIRSLLLSHAEAEAVRAAKLYLVSHPTNGLAVGTVAASLRVSAPEEAANRFAGLTVVPNELRPFAVEAYVNAAKARIAANDKDGAVQRLYRANEFGGSDESRALLASLTGAAGGTQGAATVSRTLTDYNNAIRAAFSAGKDQDALALFAEASKQYPADGTIPYLTFTQFLSRGRAIEAVGKHREAIDYFEKAAKALEPVAKAYAIKLYISAGEILEGDPHQRPKQADLDEAVGIRERVLALDANDGYANLWSAMLEITFLGDKDAAKKHLLAAKAHETEFNEVNRAILNQQLQNLGVR